MRCLAILLATAALGGCATMVPTETSLARATISAADGSARGSATISGAGDAMRLTVNATGMPPGTHGIHVHAVGKCDAPDFKTAGGHWNPAMKQHGRDNPMGAHDGDLPNLVIDANGSGSVSAPLSGNARELLDSDSAAIVIHAAADDYRTDPSGNSGDRIACGVFTGS
jgi:superoxide dismutase, Cu-Zn family